MVEASNDITMIVLGAGASIGAKRYPIDTIFHKSMYKMPSSQHFFYDLFYQSKTDWSSERFLNIFGALYEGANDFLVRAWGMTNNIDSFDAQEWKDVNVEDVFTFLDVGEKMFNKGTSYQLAFSVAKEYLEDYIIAMLGLRCENQHCEYLMSIFSKLKPADSIISFNWNTIADFTLDRLRIPQYDNYFDLMTDDRIRIRKYAEKGLYLKLHGSLNWAVCQNRACKDFGRPRLPFTKKNKKLPRIISNTYERCPSCKEKPKRLIVPPVSNKMIHKDNFLHKLWLLARDKLASVNRIVFIGYSFPPTDFYAEWLFRQMYFLIGIKPEIVVVNPEMFIRGSLVSKRYRTIFKNFKITKYRTLADYASEQ